MLCLITGVLVLVASWSFVVSFCLLVSSPLDHKIDGGKEFASGGVNKTIDADCLDRFTINRFQ